MSKAPLSRRIRPNIEAAPWVCEEVADLERLICVAVGALEIVSKMDPFADNGDEVASARAALTLLNNQ